MQTQVDRSVGSIAPSSLIQRGSFKEDFVFGTASSAYQYEGAAKEGGRGPSIWDTFTHKWPGKIDDGNNGTKAVDFYYQYKEDVKIMKKMGFDAFRFSISWSRVLPNGKISGGVNREGIKFYNDLIDELLLNGIKPFVTLFHWDLPQALEDEYHGFLSTQIVVDFCNYAKLCFWEFGDRVKNWITLNEPWSYSVGGYVYGGLAPGRGPNSSTPLNSSSMPMSSPIEDPFTWGIFTPRCYNILEEGSDDSGNPGTEPYIVAHNQILAHAAAVDLYKQNFQEYQKGQIGITLVSNWFVPYNPKSKKDCDAADRAQDFMFGWFMGPLINGDYPNTMRDRVKKRLPGFEKYPYTVKGSYDFIGVNYYTAMYVSDNPKDRCDDKLSYETDSEIKTTYWRNGEPIGPKSGSNWLYIYPQGIYNLLKYTKKQYGDLVIYITENGVCEKYDVKQTINEACLDDMRRDYHKDHLIYLRDAIESEKVNVKGYFAWSLFDNYEWSAGYTMRFGLIHVDYKDGYLERNPKDSAIWFTNFLKKDAKKTFTK